MLKYNGLRRRPTYDELIDYLHNRQETIRYPHRTKFNPDTILEDMGHDAIIRMNYDRFNKALFDKATQTDPTIMHKSIQTDPYMFDKSFQIDDDIDYDKYLDGNYKILPETVESYSKRQKKTQTKRFEPIIKQLQSRLNQTFDHEHELPAQPSLWNMLFNWGEIQQDNYDEEPDHVSIPASSKQSSPVQLLPTPQSSPEHDPTASSSRQKPQPWLNRELVANVQHKLLPYFDMF
jgi:hypothetical protein